VTAFIKLVVMDQLGIRPLRPAPRRRIDLVREDADSDRDLDPSDVEEASTRRNLRGVPVETSGRDSGVCQPVERDVLEDVVRRKAFVFPLKARAIIK
jgi:hypothetical protein